MIKIIILLLSFIVCYSESNIIGGVKISYDMNKTNIDEASLFVSKSIKNGSIISKYEMRIKNFNNDFILDIASLSFKSNLGKVILGRSRNRNKIVYSSINQFYLTKKYSFLRLSDRVEAISYIAPKTYDNVSEFDYSKKDNLKVFRSIWTKNELTTSMFYIWDKESETLGIGVHKNTKIVDFGYIYENQIEIKTTHSLALRYKVGNYFYKSLYSFNSLNKELFINGLDIFLLREENREAKVYLESSYGDIKEATTIGVSFYF